MAIAEAPLDATPGIPDTDLPDTVQTPPEALAPLPEPTLAAIRDSLHGLQEIIAQTLGRVPAVLDQQHATLVAMLETHRQSLSASEAGALQHLCETLETLGARGLAVTKPYAAQLHVKTPGGYTATLIIERVDGAAFFAALAGMEQWLTASGYTPLP